jgi:hypothetical protein
MVVEELINRKLETLFSESDPKGTDSVRTVQGRYPSADGVELVRAV